MNRARTFGWRAVAALGLLLLPAAPLHAAISCSVTSPGVSTNYDSAATTQTIVQSSVTVTCQRNAAGDATSQNYSMGADNGLNPTAGKPRAALLTNYVSYDTYTDSGCTALWKATPANSARLPSPPPGSLALGGVGVPSSATHNYWLCIPATQTGATTGIHTDTITMTLFSGTGNTSLATGSLPVSINVNSTCSITTAPGNVALTYVSFGAAANASTTFATTCTSGLPYTMALDAAGGTLLGLNYTIALSATSGTGNGSAQTYSINGAIAGGLSGTCATTTCNASAPHTLTITY